MDKSDIILDKLNSMEKALRVENKTLSDKIDRLENKVEKLENKVDKVSEKQDMSWQAIQEIRDDLTENSAQIKIIDNKVKAL
ncbi:MAG: hypothetical protein FNP40_10135 [Dehalobacter sp. 4CP]|jgi:hypothetical protein|uniref:hypothetical protein n=1 Tax=unclassified Dehalobacter TaxID=2635733 RepID=UPI00028B5BC7|nr:MULTISPECIES: hypothetical protein [unclassified Dehalobacter]MCM1566726.1 hypothetical protein [Dehalobacter sp.]NBJ15902.1 hypothetical protein [Dehalobacter sp. 4CP]AFV03435.1 hypothetical protein DHBDCA_p2408 [Dehalobacter sp. DCA]AFV06423.1 hypothetical protein DCF50_p2420 [Dehalobacter sp. CF]EQB20135.1 hypothetical protein UNSWDHB_2604 [Dehalobacter sp. UNSWDHB]